MKQLIAALLLVVLGLCPALRAADDFDDFDDDFTEDAAFEPTDWMPIITQFYVQARDEGYTIAPLQPVRDTGVLPSLKAAWEALHPRIADLRDNTFPGVIPADQPAISGFRLYQGEEGAVGYELHAGMANPGPMPQPAAEGEPIDPALKPIYTLGKGQPADVVMGVDIFVPVEAGDREQLLRDYFHVVECVITVHLISNDPRDFRAKPQDEPIVNGIIFLVSADQGSRSWDEVVAILQDGHYELPIRASGAYALRLTLTVRGRLNDYEDAPTQTVRGEVRIAKLDEAFNVDLISLERSGFSTTTGTKKPAQE